MNKYPIPEDLGWTHDQLRNPAYDGEMGIFEGYGEVDTRCNCRAEQEELGCNYPDCCAPVVTRNNAAGQVREHTMHRVASAPESTTADREPTPLRPTLQRKAWQPTKSS